MNFFPLPPVSLVNPPNYVVSPEGRTIIITILQNLNKSLDNWTVDRITSWVLGTSANEWDFKQQKCFPHLLTFPLMELTELFVYLLNFGAYLGKP